MAYFYSPLPLPINNPFIRIRNEDLENYNGGCGNTSDCSSSSCYDSITKTIEELENCDHSETLYDSTTSSCMGCGAMIVSSLAQTVAGVGGNNGKGYHICPYTPAETGGVKRKPKTTPSTVSNLSIIQFSKPISYLNENGNVEKSEIIQEDKEEFIPLTKPIDISKIEKHINIFNIPRLDVNNIPTYAHLPPPVRAGMYSTGGAGNTNHRRALHLAGAAKEAFGVTNMISCPELAGILLTGHYNFKGVKGCPSALYKIASLIQNENDEEEVDRVVKNLNNEIISTFSDIVNENSEYFFAQRRRTHVGLFLVAVAAHIRILHSDGNLDFLDDCLDIKRVFSKDKSSKKKQKSFAPAIAERSGLNPNCISRLTQIAIKISKIQIKI